MSDIISLSAARDHLRAGDEVADSQLDDLIAVAEQTVADELGFALVDPAGRWPAVEQLPANVVHAVKVVLADLYEHRITPLGDDSTVRRLIGRYISVSFG